MSNIKKEPLQKAAEGVRKRNIDNYPEWDETDDDEPARDPYLDPGFSSWDDFYNYMYR